MFLGSYGDKLLGCWKKLNARLEEILGIKYRRMSYFKKRLSEELVEKEALEAKIAGIRSEFMSGQSFLKAMSYEAEEKAIDTEISSVEGNIKTLQATLAGLKSKKAEVGKLAQIVRLSENKAMSEKVKGDYETLDTLLKEIQKTQRIVDKEDEEAKREAELEALRKLPYDEQVTIFKKEIKELENIAFVLDDNNYDEQFKMNIKEFRYQWEDKVSLWKPEVKRLYQEKFGDMSEKVRYMLDVIAREVEGSYGRLSFSDLSDVSDIYQSIYDFALKGLDANEKGKKLSYEDKTVWKSETISPPYESSWDSEKFHRFFTKGGQFIFPLYFDEEVERDDGDFRSQGSQEDDEDYYAERDDYQENADYTVEILASFDYPEAPKPEPKPEAPAPVRRKLKINLKKPDAPISIPKKDFVAEHKELVEVLKKDEPKEVAKEAKKQEAELKTTLKKSIEKHTNKEIADMIRSHLAKKGKRVALSGLNKTQLLSAYKQLVG